MKYSIIYFMFFLIEYCLRTFVNSYKFHTIGMIGEFVPLIILSFICILLNRKIIIAGKFGNIFLKFSAISILGFLTSKFILFFQWYWIIAPEYRKISGDMSEGFAWTVFFSIIGSIIIMMSYLMILGSFKLFKN